MLEVDGLARLEVGSELVVAVIVEVQSSECASVWIGRRNVADKISEIHSQTADVVQQEREAILLNTPTFTLDRPFAIKIGQRS